MNGQPYGNLSTSTDSFAPLLSCHPVEVEITQLTNALFLPLDDRLSRRRSPP